MLAKVEEKELRVKFSEIINNAEKIKSIIMLENLECKNVIDLFSKGAKLTSFIKDVSNIYTYINIIGTEDDAEIIFITISHKIAQKIIDIVKTYLEEDEQERVKKREEESKNRENITDRKFSITMPKLGQLNKQKELKEPKKKNSYDRILKNLYSNRSEYNKEFLEAYNNYIKYKEKNLKNKIEALYK